MGYSVRVIDTDFNLLMETDAYQSLVIEVDYYTGGMLTMSINRHMLPLGANGAVVDELQVGNIIFPTNSVDKPFIITYREDNFAETQGEQSINIQANSLLWILSQRITQVATDETHDSYTDKSAEYIVKQWITNNVISSIDSDTDRNISFFNVLVNQDRGSTITDQTRYENLMEEIQRVISAELMGLKVAVNIATSKFDIDVYEGNDLTYGETDAVVLGLDRGNLSSMTTYNSNINYKNFAYVGGDGEGAKRTIGESGTATSIDRKEIFFDAREVSDLTELSLRGEQALSELPEEISLEARLLEESTSVYGVDFEVGDLITIVNNNTSFTEDKRVIKVTQAREADSIIKTDLVLGNPLLTSYQILEKQIKNANTEPSTQSLTNKGYIELTKTASQNHGGTNGTITGITWETEVYKDSDFTHVASSQSITVNFTGRISVSSNIRLTNTNVGGVQLALLPSINGIGFFPVTVSVSSQGTAFGDMFFQANYELDVTDTDVLIILTDKQSTGNTGAINSVPADCTLLIRNIT